MVYSKTRQLTRRFGRKRTRRLRTQKRNVSRRIVKTHKNRRNYSGGRPIPKNVLKEILENRKKDILIKRPEYNQVMEAMAVADPDNTLCFAKLIYILESLFSIFDTRGVDTGPVKLFSPEFRVDYQRFKTVEKYGDRTFSEIPEIEKVLYCRIPNDKKKEIDRYLNLVRKHIPSPVKTQLMSQVNTQLLLIDPNFVSSGDQDLSYLFMCIKDEFTRALEYNPTSYIDPESTSYSEAESIHSYSEPQFGNELKPKKRSSGGAGGPPSVMPVLSRQSSLMIWTAFFAKFASIPDPAVVVIPDFPNTTCHPLCEPDPVQRRFNTVEFAFVLSADPNPIVLRPNPPHHYTLPISTPLFNSDYFNPAEKVIYPTDTFAVKRGKTDFRVFDFNLTNDIDAVGHGRNSINFGCIFIGSQISPSGISVAHDYNPERLAIEAEFITIQETPPPPNLPLYPYFPTPLFVGIPRKNHLTSEHVANAFFAEAVERDYGIQINNHPDARYNCCLQLAHTNHRTAMFERMYARAGYVCNAFNHHNITTGFPHRFFYAVWVCNNFIPSVNPSLTTIHGGHFLRATFVRCSLSVVGGVLQRNNDWVEVPDLFALRTLFVTTVPQWITSAVFGNSAISKLAGSFQMIRIMATFRYGMFNTLVATHDR